MLINNDITRLICLFDETKVNLYSGERISENQYEWKIIRKIWDFPFYFQNLRCSAYITPNFSHYLKYKTVENCINIKDMATNETLCTMREDIVNLKNVENVD